MAFVTFAIAKRPQRRDVCTEQVSRQTSRYTLPFPKIITPSSRNGYPCVNSGNCSAMDLNVYLLLACARALWAEYVKTEAHGESVTCRSEAHNRLSRSKLNFWVPVLNPKKISCLFLRSWVVDLCNITVDIIRIPLGSSSAGGKETQ